ncbi:MAG: TraB/VirB10 family protein [Bdellovibrionales bacterium]|nr:TraB/VirB10 family protein [Bdellovibrionales bacterium]
MAMKQKLQDLTLLLQKSRKAQVIAGCCLFGILFLLFSDNGQHRRRPVAPQPFQAAKGVGEFGENEAFDDLTTSIIRKQEEHDSEMKVLRTTLEDMRVERKEDQERSAQIFKKLISVLNSREAASGQSAPSAPGVSPEPIDIQPNVPLEETDSLVPIEDDAPVEVAPPPAPVDPRVAVISPADSVRVQLLSGVNAPTDGTPYPTVFKLVSDVTGPDGSSLPLGEARIIAAAQGSLTDQRVLYRLTKLSIRLPDGSRQEVTIDGWIVGEDGIRGMQGNLIDPLGKALLGTAYTGFIGGLGTGISDANSTTITNEDGGIQTFVTGNTAQYALGQGLSQTASQYSQIIQERLRSLKPVVQVYSGRQATAVFSQSADIPFLYEALEGDEFDVFPTSLD